MQALDLRDNSLQWETERQNRIHQDAVEQKKKQARLESARRESPRNDPITQAVAIAPEEWIDKIHRIPNMRSALIPPDDDLNIEGWSKPFSLHKADMEPWLSYYKGYKQSRLFIETPAARNAPAGEQSELSLDFPVRALLELKQVNARLISEPPVQIDGQVEYPDLGDEIRDSRDSMRVRALLKYVGDMHNAQLRTAVEKGREMGNLLHDALMGEGHANLIKAWINAHKRKPTVDELHLMLTTGRVKISAERKPPMAESMERLPEPKHIAPAIKSVPVKQPEAVVPHERVPQRDAAKADKKIVIPEAAVAEPDFSVAEAPEKGNRKLKILLYLLQGAVCCVALAAIALSF